MKFVHSLASGPVVVWAEYEAADPGVGEPETMSVDTSRELLPWELEIVTEAAWNQHEADHDPSDHDHECDARREREMFGEG